MVGNFFRKVERLAIPSRKRSGVLVFMIELDAVSIPQEFGERCVSVAVTNGIREKRYE